MIKFEEYKGQLFRMLEEPVPLTPDAEMPCVVRLIQDDSPMGMYIRDTAYFDVISDMRFFAQKIKENTLYSNTLHAYYKDSNGKDSCIASIHTLEIIGYPVEEGSHWWALWAMMQGKKVSPKSAIGNVYWALNQDGDVQYYEMDNLACIGLIRNKLEFWKKYVAKTGWQIYKEPKPETAKDPEIVAHKQHATCLMCGKEIKGLLDRHATVSIKRYSISSLYESTYSHYCGKCFLELGFDATERKLRNRQQPIAEPKPEPAKEQFEVGDWVEWCGDQYMVESAPPQSGSRYDIRSPYDELGCSVYPENITRKLSPSEVIVHIGCLSGTVRRINDIYFALNPSSKAGWVVPEASIPHAMLDTHTRELVESLLEAQEEMGGEE